MKVRVADVFLGQTTEHNEVAENTCQTSFADSRLGCIDLDERLLQSIRALKA